MISLRQHGLHSVFARVAIVESQHDLLPVSSCLYALTTFNSRLPWVQMYYPMQAAIACLLGPFCCLLGLIGSLASANLISNLLFERLTHYCLVLSLVSAVTAPAFLGHLAMLWAMEPASFPASMALRMPQMLSWTSFQWTQLAP